MSSLNGVGGNLEEQTYSYVHAKVFFFVFKLGYYYGIIA